MCIRPCQPLSPQRQQYTILCHKGAHARDAPSPHCHELVTVSPVHCGLKRGSSVHQWISKLGTSSAPTPLKIPHYQCPAACQHTKVPASGLKKNSSSATFHHLNQSIVCWYSRTLLRQLSFIACAFHHTLPLSLTRSTITSRI